MKLRNRQVVNRQTIEQLAGEFADVMANATGSDGAPDWYEVQRYVNFRLDTVEGFADRYDSDATIWFDQAFADRIAERMHEFYS